MQRVDDGRIGDIGIGAVGVHRQRTIEASNRYVDRRCRASSAAYCSEAVSPLSRSAPTSVPVRLPKLVVRRGIGELARGHSAASVGVSLAPVTSTVRTAVAVAPFTSVVCTVKVSV